MALFTAPFQAEVRKVAKLDYPGDYVRRDYKLMIQNRSFIHK
jgi:hypothetical protein